MIMKIGINKNEMTANIIDETKGTNLRGIKIMFTREILNKDASLDLGAMIVTLFPKFSKCLKMSKRDCAWRKTSTVVGLIQRAEIDLKPITLLNVLAKIYDFESTFTFPNSVTSRHSRILPEILAHARKLNIKETL